EPPMFTATLRDITERQRAEEALRASAEFNRKIIESSRDCVKILDLEGRLLSMSEGGQRQLCIPDLAPLLGKSWIGFWDAAADRTAAQEAVLKARAGGSGNFTGVYATPGVPRWWDVVVTPMLNAQGEPEKLLAISREVTGRVLSEQASKAAAEELARSSRAKDDFLAALSHELRTPLTPVLMTATAMEGDPALPAEVRGQVSMIRRNIELEARLIDDLLDLTRITHGKMKIAPVVTDIHQLLDHTAEIVRSEGSGKQVRTFFRLEAARHHAMVDPARFQQVFWNVVKNALKFTPSGGSVTVSTSNDAGGGILVSVEDTGIGISPEGLSHIFNAFEQGDAAGQHRYGGLGLGLAISRAIVEAHDGAIRADSAGVGRGATFTVSLDTVDAPSAPLHESAPQRAPARALRLLVVEDHEATRTVLTRLLTRSGHHITAVTTVRDALAAFAAERFDAVISDLGLPDGSGLDLMREIQRQRPVPAIALSGYGMEDDLRQTKEAGFSAHLVKPVNVDQLRDLLDRITLPVE
ncbi:MAG: ATP-binding protein, partial [Chthoniobacteraceae bacterium]